MGNRTNVFVEGGVTATYWDSSANGWEWSYEFSDWQGTKRVQANALGAENLWQSDPYNDYMTPIVAGQDATEHHYTQKERDVESGNDYFGARYYTSLMGRFMSPDWSAKVEPVPYAKAGDPRSLNLYAFVGNNPLSHVDVDGHTGVTNGLAMEAQYAEGNSNWAAYSAALEQAAANRYAAAHENSAAEKAQQQSGLQKPLVGPSQTGVPAALRSGGPTETYSTTSPLTLSDGTTKEGGNIYQYQVVDAKGYAVLTDQAVTESFSNTAKTDPNVAKPTAGTFDAKGGHFQILFSVDCLVEQITSSFKASNLCSCKDLTTQFTR